MREFFGFFLGGGGEKKEIYPSGIHPRRKGGIHNTSLTGGEREEEKRLCVPCREPKEKEKKRGGGRQTPFLYGPIERGKKGGLVFKECETRFLLKERKKKPTIVSGRFPRGEGKEKGEKAGPLGEKRENVHTKKKRSQYRNVKNVQLAKKERGRTGFPKSAIGGEKKKAKGCVHALASDREKKGELRLHGERGGRKKKLFMLRKAPGFEVWSDNMTEKGGGKTAPECVGSQKKKKRGVR